jgi:hypothetical protein
MIGSDGDFEPQVARIQKRSPSTDSSESSEKNDKKLKKKLVMKAKDQKPVMKSKKGSSKSNKSKSKEKNIMRRQTVQIAMTKPNWTAIPGSPSEQTSAG